MITLFHGDDITASRAALDRMIEREKNKEIRRLEGKNIDTTLLVQSLESSSLFGGETLAVIDGLFGQITKKQKRIEELTRILLEAGCDVFLWEDRLLPPGIVSKLGKASVQQFKLPAIIFSLLDGLRPKCASACLPLLERVLDMQPAEVVYAMLFRRIRELIQLQDRVTPERMAPWMAMRLTAQSRSFTMNELIAMHGALVEMDTRIKSGSSPFSMAQLLEQFLIAL